MNAPDQVIVLAAGKSSQLDGISKVLIRHPRNCRTILDHVIEAFAGCKITVVVGFRAIHIMQHYPELHYVHNPDWALTNNAGSLGLALAELGPKPCYVISGDIFLERALIERLNTAAPNMVLTSTREKRAQSAVHCVTDEDGRVLETYQGPVRSMAHPESVGLSRSVRRRCCALGSGAVSNTPISLPGSCCRAARTMPRSPRWLCATTSSSSKLTRPPTTSN